MTTTADDLFTSLYAKYWRRITWYMRERLDDRHVDYAEDLAQETFIRFWRYYAVKGKPGSYTLLTLQARSTLAAFYETRAAGERATDFADPVNAPLASACGTYAIGRPDMAPVVRELEAALEQMAEASQEWRGQHKAAGALRGRIAKCTKAEKIAQREAEYREATGRSERLLITFRDACRRVGDLRAELERAGGPRWNASSGGPDAPAEREKTAGALKSDPTVTHCSKGHRLDLENANFDADGSRRCRTCKTDHERGRRAQALAGAAR
jgi:DNA-directed RNA polymerase specialized sigma24 family protein